jgi:hypothetical protein
MRYTTLPEKQPILPGCSPKLHPFFCGERFYLLYTGVFCSADIYLLYTGVFCSADIYLLYTGVFIPVQHPLLVFYVKPQSKFSWQNTIFWLHRKGAKRTKERKGIMQELFIVFSASLPLCISVLKSRISNAGFFLSTQRRKENKGTQRDYARTLYSILCFSAPLHLCIEKSNLQCWLFSFNAKAQREQRNAKGF